MSTSHLENKFKERGKKGDAGEVMLFEHLQAQYSVSDYRLDWDKQRNGIDFGIKKDTWKFEVQLDVKNNLYVEDNLIVIPIEFSQGVNPGWFYTSHAHRIYHISTFKRTVIMYDLNKMRYVINNRLINGNMTGIKRERFGNDVILKLDMLSMPDVQELCTKFLV